MGGPTQHTRACCCSQVVHEADLMQMVEMTSLHAQPRLIPHCGCKAAALPLMPSVLLLMAQL
jgi:hypothetical protein